MARVFDGPGGWLKAYVQYTSDLEAPDHVHFWVGVSMIAGALRRRVWIEQPKFDWTPNFYIILVGPPGIVGKSTCMGAGTALLEKVKGVHFGADSLTWQALGKDLMDAKDVVTLGSGATAEKFPMSCLTIAASELGTFLKLDDDGLASMLIAMWDGQRSMRPFRHLTVSSSNLSIENPWLNIIGCTTPTWMKKNFPLEHIGGGLTSRIIFVFADKKRKLIAYPSRLWQGNAQKQIREGLIHDLTEMSKLKGRYTLTDEAMDWGEEWYKNLWEGERPAHLVSERYSGYIARKQTTLHKLSMVLAASRSDDLIITRDHLIEANALMDMVERDMIKVFESIGLVEEARRLSEIEQLILGAPNHELTTAELWARCYRVMDQKAFQEAVKAGIEAGQLEKVEVNRPDARYVLRVKNPPGTT